MATSRDTFESVIYVNNEQAQDATEKLRQKLEKLNKEYEALNNAEEKDIKQILKKKKQIDDTTRSLESITEGTENYKKALDNLSEHSMEKLVKMQRLIESELKKTKPDTEEWKKLADEHARVTERLNSLRTAYKHVGTEQTGLAAKLNKIQGLWVVGTGILGKVATALRGVAKFTNQVIHSSQTMGDAWDNAVTAMKTATNAFFVALSTGNWDAFNGGLREAIRNANEYAAALDKLESRRISNEYMKTEYLTNYREDMVTANDKSQDEATRRAALESAKSNLDEYINSINKLGADTKTKLVASYKALYGIDYTGDELGFDQFFDELYKNVIVDENETVNKMSARLNELKSKARAELTEGMSVLDYQGGASQWINEQTEKKAMEEMRKEFSELQMNLWKGYEIVDDQLKADLADFKQYKDAIREVSRYQKQLNSEEATFSSQIEAEKAAAAKKALEDKKAAAEASYQAELKRLEKERYANTQHYAAMYMKGEIDKKAYDAQMIVIEDAYLVEKLALNQRFGKDTDAISQTILDRQIKRYEDAKKTIKTLMDDEANFDENYKPQWQIDEENDAENNRKQNQQDAYGQYDESLAPILQKAAEIRASIQETNLRSEYETELMWLEKLKKKKFLSEEEYEAAKLKLRMDYAAKAAQKTNEILGAAANLSAAIQEAETANLEAEYQARLTAAGDNAEQREAIEAEYEQKKLDLQKKYANADMVIQIAQATASAAAACVEAWKEAEGNPYLAATLIGLITASTGAQIATIIAQRNAIMNTTASGSNGGSGNAGYRVLNEGYAKGGFTEGHTTITTVGERGTEWVAPHWMVRQNPVTFANLERYRKSGSFGRSGSVGHGFADGGFTNGTDAIQMNFGRDNAVMERLAAILERLETNGISATVDYPQLKRFEQKDQSYRKEISR